MKKESFIALLCAYSLLLLMYGCEKAIKDNLNPDEDKGLIQITDLSYNNDTMAFVLSIQYSSSGKETDLEYAIYSENVLIQKGTKNTSIKDFGLNIFFETEVITLIVPKSVYSGKTMLVWADPDNKRTQSTYTTESYVNLYKKAEVVVPE